MKRQCLVSGVFSGDSKVQSVIRIPLYPISNSIHSWDFVQGIRPRREVLRLHPQNVQWHPYAGNVGDESSTPAVVLRDTVETSHQCPSQNSNTKPKISK